ncbi:hypothetical protein NBRC116494_15670 [Aurantivibrio plasticivorans]
MNDHNQQKSDDAKEALSKKVKYLKSVVDDRLKKNISCDGLPRSVSDFLIWSEGGVNVTNGTYLYKERNKEFLKQVKSLVKKVKTPKATVGNTIKGLKEEIETLNLQVAGLVDANRDLRVKLNEQDRKLRQYERRLCAGEGECKCTLG